MRVISKVRLVEFWESRKADSAIAERDLSAWYKLASHTKWTNFAALRQTFGSADQVGNRVNYRRGVVYVLTVMDHTEYDKNLWPDDCGCHEPPPKGKSTPGGPKRGK